ncbi:MAG TPA: arylamine N-acetyltransferase [Chloroflexia bacterium]|nr:arylamine N-acetyltransferase [Chloroflexia bacterium]
MELEKYLQRINYHDALKTDVETLKKLHRAHLLAIPYENFDIHLGRRIEHDEQAFYNKLVLQRRGGWCYEMNGLFAWALRQAGFKVHLLSGSVRNSLNDDGEGNHLTLLVELERPYLVDVGFGDGFLEPLPLEEGEFEQGFLSFRLTREGEYWICHNHPHGGAKRYDFTLKPRRLEEFAARSHELQTSPTSGFVRTAVCQHYTSDSLIILRGALFKSVSAAGVEEKTVTSEAEFKQVLKEHFKLDLGDTAELWPKIWERHQEWLRQQQSQPI